VHRYKSQLFVRQSLVSIALIVLAMCSHSDAQQTSEDFERWAKTQASPIKSVELGSDLADLRPFKSIIGSARVVALGEPAHGAHEPLAFRNKLFRYLVEELGFTTISLEGGLPESRLIYDFVAGGSVTMEQVLRNGFSCGSGDIKEHEELIRWMRDYNANPGHARKLRFYAIDVGRCGQGTPLAYENALTYLTRVDPESGKRQRATLQPYLDRLAEGDAKPLSKTESDGLSAAIEDLLALLERERPAFIAASSENDYQWAHRNAVTSRQAHRQYRVLPTSPPPGGGIPPSVWRPLSQRNAAMADNVRWVMDREGSSARMLLAAHYGHIKNAPTEGGIWSAFERPATVMGQHLRSALGSDLVILGISSSKNGEGLPPASAEPNSLDATLARVGPTPFFLDLRPARSNQIVSAWLAERRPMRANSSFMLLSPIAAFDALVYIDTLTPAGRSTLLR
jgi:erythromycin esterase